MHDTRQAEVNRVGYAHSPRRIATDEELAELVRRYEDRCHVCGSRPDEACARRGYDPACPPMDARWIGQAPISDADAEVLARIAEHGRPSYAKGLAKTMGADVGRMTRALLRLLRSGAVEGDVTPGGHRRFVITKKGRRHLARRAAKAAMDV